MAHLTIVALSLVLAGTAIHVVMSLTARDVMEQPVDAAADAER